MTGKTWRTWTVKEKRHLEDLRARGKTAAEIAAELGRSLPSVKCQIQQQQAPKFSPRRLEWLHVLTLGLTEREVAARMGVSKWAVKRAKQRIRRGRS